MKNNRSEHITGKELDGLLNEAFLNLDFETDSQNKEMLSIVSQQAMDKKTVSSFLNVDRLNSLFFLFSVLICITSFYQYVYFLRNKKTEYSNPVQQTKRANVYKSNPVSQPAALPVRHNASKVIRVSDRKNLAPVKHKIKQATANAPVAPVIPEINTDSLSKVSKAGDTLDTSGTKLHVDPDPLNKSIPVKFAEDALPLKSNIEKSPKGVKALTTDVKAKAGKRRKGKLFHKDGTFRMKGRKYGKSKRPYHR